MQQTMVKLCSFSTIALENKTRIDRNRIEEIHFVSTWVQNVDLDIEHTSI
jgi:hypothetical protein